MRLARLAPEAAAMALMSVGSGLKDEREKESDTRRDDDLSRHTEQALEDETADASQCESDDLPNTVCSRLDSASAVRTLAEAVGPCRRDNPPASRSIMEGGDGWTGDEDDLTDNDMMDDKKFAMAIMGPERTLRGGGSVTVPGNIHLNLRARAWTPAYVSGFGARIRTSRTPRLS